MPNREDRAAPNWTWMLEVTAGSKEEMGDKLGWFSTAGTVNATWVITRETRELGDTWRREKSWAMLDPDLDSVQSG